MTGEINEARIANKEVVGWVPTTRKDSEALLLAGKYDLFLQLTESTRVEDLRKNPIILVYRAAAMFFSEYPTDVILKEIRKAEKLDQLCKLAGEIDALRAIINIYSDDPEKSIQQSQIALAKIDPKNIFFKNIIERNLGIAYTIKNDLNNANIWFENLLMSSYSLKDWGGVLAAYNYLTYIRKIQGCLTEAGVIYRKALNFIDEKRLSFMPHSIKIISGYGHLLLKWHKIDEAKTQIRRAIQLAKDTDIVYGFTAYQNLSAAFLKENDTRSALSVIQELRHLIQDKQDLYQDIHIKQTQVIEARVHLAIGRIDKAYEWLISSGINNISEQELSSKYGFQLGSILPTAAQIYIAKGQTDKAIQILDGIIPQFLNQGAITYLIQALCVLSVAQYQQSDFEKATISISKALRLAEPEENVGDCICIGRPLIPVISMISHESTCYSFINRLSGILSTIENKSITNQNETAHHSPLSHREMDVLNLIAQGMTNREIARELFLSANTIKSHSIKIYRKLNVNDRNQAVHKARLLGILPTHSTSMHNSFVQT